MDLIEIILTVLSIAGLACIGTFIMLGVFALAFGKY